ATGIYGVATGQNDLATGIYGVATRQNDLATGIYGVATGQNDLTTGFRDLQVNLFEQTRVSPGFHLPGAVASCGGVVTTKFTEHCRVK
ncbi:hypothetical protein, partial [Saccharicrinis sp. 156]|uniref:hypothetical protein n=1 Tax=Saccharicrinis sp. 156 TaxID=3417574 RepID=UPI003D338749